MPKRRPSPPARMLPRRARRQSSSTLVDATPWLACPPGVLPVAIVLIACANTLLAVASNLLAVAINLIAVANFLLAVATYFLFDYTYPESHFYFLLLLLHHYHAYTPR